MTRTRSIEATDIRGGARVAPPTATVLWNPRCSLWASRTVPSPLYPVIRLIHLKQPYESTRLKCFNRVLIGCDALMPLQSGARTDRD